mgnify:CR=1 FL=1
MLPLIYIPGILMYTISLKLKQIFKSFISVLILVSFLSCVGSKPNNDSINQNIEHLIERGKGYWEQRTDTDAMFKAANFLTLAYNKRVNDFELAILIGELKFTLGYFEEINLEKAESIFFEGAQICSNAVLQHPDFSNLFENTKGDGKLKLLTSINNAPPSVISGLYWWAINLAHYLKNRPVLERLNQRELMEVIMNRVLAIEPSFHFSGPYRFFGLLYTRIPGLDLSQSETYFNQSLNSNPEYLGNSVQMAEFYHQKAGNREQFNKILNNVINTNLNNYPEIIADNLFFQKKARILLDNESSLFE